MSRLQLALDQITFARTYTVRLLNRTGEVDWFRLPPGGVSHVGWQPRSRACCVVTPY